MTAKAGASRQELEIALAVARERLLGVHTVQALELIRHARPDVSAERALGIYVRLHQVSGNDAPVLQTRVLARLGEESSRLPAGEKAGGVTDDAWNSPWSWLKQLRRRLRGRRNLELRRWVELHAGRTEVELLRVHVEGAIRLIDLLEPKESFAEVVQLYTERMGVPQSVSRALYFLTLNRLSQVSAAAAADPATPDPGAKEAQQQPLRIVTR